MLVLVVRVCCCFSIQPPQARVEPLSAAIDAACALPASGSQLRDAYPTFEIADDGEPADRATLREIFRSKNVPLLGLEMRTAEESLSDMAEAMLAHGVVRPKAGHS